MIPFLLKIYEFFYLILINILQCINFFYHNKNLEQFLRLRSPRLFLEEVFNVKQKLETLKKQNSKIDVYWFHVASAGELEQAIPVAKALHEQFGVYFFVTYYSASAEPFLKNFPNLLGSCGLPRDSKIVYLKALKIYPFKKLFFVRYDLWPSLLETTSNENVSLYLLGATVKSTREGLRGFFSKKLNTYFYQKFSTIFVTHQGDLLHLKQQFPNKNIILAGDPKWMRAQERAQNFQKQIVKEHAQNLDVPLPASLDVFNLSTQNFVNFFHIIQNVLLSSKKKCLVHGSPHKEEHEIALKCGNITSLLNIYVPHKISPSICKTLAQEFKGQEISYCFYSEIFTKSIDEICNYNLIIIDKIGHLAEIYALAEVAIVGGGFDGQIHNTLEASAHGVPVLIGNNYKRAPEAEILVNGLAALPFLNPNLLFQFVSRWGTLKGYIKELDVAKQQTKILFNEALNTNKIILNTLLQENQTHAHKTTDYKHNRL